MSVFDCSSEITSYHNAEVTLGDAERTHMRERRNNGRTRLTNGLVDNGHPLPTMTCSQGSYQMRTMIQDDKCDYDIDDGVYFLPENLKNANGDELTPLEVRQRICDALTYDRRFENPAEVRSNCVRQEYQMGYHIDMPVYRIRIEDEDTDEREVFELASKDAWVLSDARAVTRWFKDRVKELNSEEGDDGNQMRRLVRMTKAFARSREEWKVKATSGITITRLIVDEFHSVEDRDDEALFETWIAIKARLNKSTRVEHPINPTDLAGDSDEKVQFFRDKLSEALSDLEVLVQDDCTRNEAREAWDSTFNTTYIGNLPDPNEPDEGKKAFFVSTESKTDKRDDGNGRYGSGSVV